ncbi:MAG TPA: hypothetical protein VEG30_03000 [Terriglobales bacterium]|nr:hypothetical protein [Terriglobales bacterium]
MLPHRLEFCADHDSEFFAAIPAKPAVFLLQGDTGSQPYVSKTSNLRRRLTRLLSEPEQHTRRLNLRSQVRTVEYGLTGSDFESTLLLYQVLRASFPKNYLDRLKLRFAPLVRLHLDNPYPRASVTVRISRLKGDAVYYGPFPSRVAAEKFANDSLDFFKMRRCVDDLNPDPAFPGCIYSEMKMCLAPCFKGCRDEEYAAEVAEVRAYFDSRGQSLLRQLGAARDRASAELDFENAAAIHARMEKLTPVLGQLPEIVHRIDQLSALMIQPSAEPESVTLFRIDAGRFSAPIPFGLRQESGQPHSMEGRLQQILSGVSSPPAATALEIMEQLAILRRWYYRTNKTGEIFFADDRGEFPWRRIVRAVSRVFRGEKPAPDLSESARDYWINRGREADRAEP